MKVIKANVVGNVLVIICESEEQARRIHKKFDEFLKYAHFRIEKGFFSGLTMVEEKRR